MKETKKIIRISNKTYNMIGIIILFILVGYYLLTKTVVFQAQFADSMLRPLVGEKNTLFLESIYFGIEDKINAVSYLFSKQKAPAYIAKTTTKKSTPKQADYMNLNNLPIDKILPPISGEGIWSSISQNIYPQDVIIARTFIRPDPSHPYAITTLVKMDMKKLTLSTQAGTYYPGGPLGARGPGLIPQNIQKSNGLLAAFNGGFQIRDGHYGMIVNNKIYVPLKNGIPVLLMYNNGTLKLQNYNGQKLPPDVYAVRQNGPYLIENGKITSYVEQGVDTWGRTTTNSMYTWRSAIGITKNGNLIYAVGNSLIPRTLSYALLKAGAVNAIQLDINYPWIKFEVYESNGNGKYLNYPLLQNMKNGLSYLSGNNKDFFYVYKKLAE